MRFKKAQKKEATKRCNVAAAGTFFSNEEVSTRLIDMRQGKT
nr:MAG TPA: hypothetical protein [Caudoviricetes sp.]